MQRRILASLVLTMVLTTPAWAGDPPTQRALDSGARSKRVITKRQARRAAQNTAYAAQRAREAAWEAYQAREAERLFPIRAEQQRLDAEQQRLYLENQRQWLARQTEMERNAILDRIAGAAERSSGYYTPRNSGIR